MPTYRVKPGKRHGPRDEFGPGDLVQHTEYEASGFLDKLELVIELPAIEESVIPVSEPPPVAEPEKPKRPKQLKRKPAAEPVIPALEPAELAETKAGE